MTTSGRSAVYWDRTERSVRDWNTGAELPEYQGPCLVYFDLRGPTMMDTFLQDGKRCWREIQPRQNTYVDKLVTSPGEA